MCLLQIKPLTKEWPPELIQALPDYLYSAQQLDMTVPNINWSPEPLLGGR
jgi:hypothetical protein